MQLGKNYIHTAKHSKIEQNAILLLKLHNEREAYNQLLINTNSKHRRTSTHTHTNKNTQVEGKECGLWAPYRTISPYPEGQRTGTAGSGAGTSRGGVNL